MSDDIHEWDEDNEPRYLPLEEIENMALFRALDSLYIIGQDMFMRSQAHNLQLVDDFLTKLEYQVLRNLIAGERTPPGTYFCYLRGLIYPICANSSSHLNRAYLFSASRP